MCMCDSHKNDNDNKNKNKKGNEDMNAVVDINTKSRGKKQVQISSKAVENLMNRKTVIKCKDGVAQIDKNHPDYNFWMED